MTRAACVHEQDVVRAVLTRRWTDGSDDPRGGEAALRTHAEACEICNEAARIAVLFSEARQEAVRDAHVPAAGQVWWRAAVRAHAEAGRAARRRLIWVQGIVGAGAVGLGAALVGLAWPSIRQATAWMLPVEPDFHLGVPNLAPLVEMLEPALLPSFLIALIALTCLVLTPIVVYFVLSDD